MTIPLVNPIHPLLSNEITRYATLQSVYDFSMFFELTRSGYKELSSKSWFIPTGVLHVNVDTAKIDFLRKHNAKFLSVNGTSTVTQMRFLVFDNRAAATLWKLTFGGEVREPCEIDP